jgi:hypothetical protein
MSDIESNSDEASITDAEPTAIHASRHNQLVPFLLIVVAVLIMGLGTLFFLFERDSEVPLDETKEILPTTQQQPNADEATSWTSRLHKDGIIWASYSDVGNFAFTVPEGWSEIEPTAYSRPLGTENQVFTLQNLSFPCFISYVKRPWYKDVVEDSYVFTSVYENSLLSGKWFSLRWKAPRESLTSSIINQSIDEGRIRKPFINEVLQTTYPVSGFRFSTTSLGEFFLSNPGGTVQNQQCISDYINLLLSLRPQYLPIQLSEETGGNLILLREGSDLGIYLDSNEDYLYKVTSLNMGQSSNIILRDNKLFFTSPHKLIAVDPFSQKVYEVPGIDAGKQVVISFDFYGDKVFYLIGDEGCNDYKGRCSNDLYEYNPQSRDSILLASELTTRDLVGYDEVNDKLYLKYSDGDAGCMSARLESYDFKMKQVVPVLRYAFCDGESESDELKKYRDLEKTLEDDQSFYTRDIVVESGKLIPSRQSVGYSRGEMGVTYKTGGFLPLVEI